MTQSRRPEPHLSLVPKSPPAAPSDPQRSLFPMSGRPRLIVVDVPSVPGDMFFAAVAATRPRLVFDLRAVPAFEQWRGGRSEVFARFREVGCVYHDVAPIVGLNGVGTAQVGSGELATEISRLYLRHESVPVSSIFILVNSAESVQASIRAFPSYLQPIPQGGWRVEVLAGSKYW